MRQRRFESHPRPRPDRVQGLPKDHPAVVEGRTIFPSRVVNAEDAPRLLVSGVNSRKIGKQITKGPWTGMPIFTLTLEERATCPRSCAHWRDCYGNAMHWSRRHRHGPELEARLERELAHLQDRHPRGFVVRLHVLGDFYSVEYVWLWHTFLERFPALRVFGYTAHESRSDMGKCIRQTVLRWPTRFVIRMSGYHGPYGAFTVDYAPEGPTVPEGGGAVVCPAQTSATECCATCGLCWSPSYLHRPIAFILHGNPYRGGEKK